MITAKCSTCEKEFPRLETLTVRNRILCQPCTEQFIEQYGDSMTQGDVVRNVDPTICNWCQTDSGQTALGEVASLPICEPCEARLRNWPFPGWIKIAFVTLAILGVGSFLFNLRHVEGAFASRAAHRAMQAGQINVALERARYAVQKVPEFVPYRIFADLVESISLVSDDQNAAALEKLRKLNAEVPGLPIVKQLMDAAEIGAAFDKKDYDRFLELANQIHAANPDDRRYSFQVASANACKFAVTANDEFKTATLERLTALGDDRSAEETEYRQRILFRLATRRIIDRKQFKDEFPNGWKPEE